VRNNVVTVTGVSKKKKRLKGNGTLHTNHKIATM
jgi:hypothetical protein